MPKVVGADSSAVVHADLRPRYQRAARDDTVAPLPDNMVALKSIIGNSRVSSYLRGVSAGYAYIVVSAASKTVAIPIYLAALGKKDFGVWLFLMAAGNMCRMTVTWLSPCVIARLGRSFAISDRRESNSIFSATVLIYGTGSAAIVLVAVLLAVWSPSIRPLGGVMTQEVRIAVIGTGVWIVATLFAQARVSALIAAQRLDVANWLLAVDVALGTSAAAIAAWLGVGLAAIAGCHAASALILVLLARLATRKHLGRHRLRASADQVKILLRDGKPYAVGAFSVLLMNSDIVVLGFLLGPTKSAGYGVAFKLFEILTLILRKPSESLQPYIIDLDARNREGRLQGLFIASTRTTLMLALAGGIGLALLGTTVMDLWVGSANGVSGSVLAWLGCSAALSVYVNANFVYPFSMLRMQSISRVLLLEALAKISFSVVLVMLFGTVGMPMASVVVMLLLSGWYVPYRTARLLRLGPATIVRDHLLRAASAVIAVSATILAIRALIPLQAPMLFLAILGTVGVLVALIWPDVAQTRRLALGPPPSVGSVDVRDQTP